MRAEIFAAIAALTICGCADKLQDAPLDKWSWLPRSTTHDEEASAIPKDAAVFYQIPKDDPLKAKSGGETDTGGGWGRIDTQGNFVPTDKQSYVVQGGTLISSLGTIQKHAKYGDWDVVYANVERTERVGWGHCLTSGEILMPRNAFGEPPASMFVQNSFAVETFGADFVLIRMDPAKKHKLCFMQTGSSDVSTVSYIGTSAEVEGRVLERKADGWYFGKKRVSE
ncbi:MAG TPA: hypothetical protein VGD45_24865 [Steroidobacter sp.]|uniref:hypothetical protein n=1 Tax=Steroidobacter sp. TaxID=1978227 RepID=UPI002ED79E8C